MNPTEALPQDYPLYYDGCYMRHNGVVKFVRATPGQLAAYAVGGGMNGGEFVQPTQLACWWPRAGAYNVEGVGGVYIARTTKRSMKKSMYLPDHYVVKWGMPVDGVMIAKTMAAGFEKHDLDFAEKVLRNGLLSSIAVNKDIIFSMGGQKEIEVIFHGIHVGEYVLKTFVPLVQNSGLARRVAMKLFREDM